tara:strand:- start:290 stop:493 length:204 start_codon:yes stop_codon:yes gene_type:complete
MALENAEVLENLRTQLKDITVQLNTLTETRMKLLGAVDVLEQIEQSKEEDVVPETGTVEVVDNEGGE